MTVYYPLYIQCPACLHEGKNPGPASNWYHANCGGTLEIGDNAYYRCKSCSYTCHVRYWRYSCRDHAGSFLATSSSHFASAISISSQLVDRVNRSWLYKLLDNLEDW